MAFWVMKHKLNHIIIGLKSLALKVPWFHNWEWQLLVTENFKAKSIHTDAKIHDQTVQTHAVLKYLREYFGTGLEAFDI